MNEIPSGRRRRSVRPTVAGLVALAAIGCGSFRDFNERMADTRRTFTGSSYYDPEAEATGAAALNAGPEPPIDAEA